jgi:hypothetical protein
LNANKELKNRWRGKKKKDCVDRWTNNGHKEGIGQVTVGLETSWKERR